MITKEKQLAALNTVLAGTMYDDIKFFAETARKSAEIGRRIMAAFAAAISIDSDEAACEIAAKRLSREKE